MALFRGQTDITSHGVRSELGPLWLNTLAARPPIAKPLAVVGPVLIQPHD